MGENPAIVVDKMRPHTQRVWLSLSAEDKRAFVARHAARWNVLRHRIAQSIHQRVMEAIESGRLKLTSGGVARLSQDETGARIRVHLRAPTSSSARRTDSFIDAALVLNCTGPDTRFSVTPSLLLRRLLASGQAQPDLMDMGIRVAPDFAVVERSGARSPFIYAIGPLLRGTLWETVAVPELRGQAMHVAQAVLGTWPKPNERPITATDEPAVIEYWI
jgi:uncharacterized NAD(P)/FAD-binding protein YdhS